MRKAPETLKGPKVTSEPQATIIKDNHLAYLTNIWF